LNKFDVKGRVLVIVWYNQHLIHDEAIILYACEYGSHI